MFAKLFKRATVALEVRVTPADIAFTVEGRKTVLQAALDQGIAYPHNCRVGACGTCKSRLVSGQVKELTDKSYLLNDAEMNAGIILACQSVPKTDLVLEVPGLTAGAAGQAVEQSEAVIEGLDRLTSDIMALRLRTPAPLRYLAGQYAELARNGSDGWRHYSFATPPGAAGTDRPAFYVRHVAGGEFSGWLFGAAAVGDALTLRAPYGDFWLRASAAPILAIAGGSGLGPVKAMLEQARLDKIPRDATVVFGVRSQADLYALDELASLARGWSCRLDLHPVLSAEPEGSDWRGARGTVRDFLAAFPRDALARHHAYLCGPPAMIDTALPVLTGAGIATADIHYDAFTDRSSATVPRR
jgi:NAD(P)H-flavin reductase/ferredoxin